MIPHGLARWVTRPEIWGLLLPAAPAAHCPLRLCSPESWTPFWCWSSCGATGSWKASESAARDSLTGSSSRSSANGEPTGAGHGWGSGWDGGEQAGWRDRRTTEIHSVGDSCPVSQAMRSWPQTPFPKASWTGSRPAF